MTIFIIRFLRRSTFLCLVTLSSFFITSVVASQPDFVIIATASPEGVYHPAGNALCRIVNQERKKSKKHAIHCSTLNTNGSPENIKSLVAGDVDLAIVQSDVFHDSLSASSGLVKTTGLRTVMKLYKEAFTVVVRSDSSIKKLDDLVSKHVNVGPQGSGHYYTMQALMRTKEWFVSDFKSLTNLDVTKQSKSLCNGDIDALVFSTGHPSGALKQIVSHCDVRLLNIDAEDVEQLISSNKAYEETIISAGTYKNNNKDIKTFSVTSLLVARNQLGSDVIQNIIDNVADNLDIFKSMHPAFEALSETPFLIDDANSNKTINK